MQSKAQFNTVQFATIAANLLNQGVLEVGRTAAKRMFRELEAGRRIALTQLRMEDGSLTRIDLTMDAQAFQGTMNYSAFRDGVLALVARLSDAIREEREIGLLSPLDNGQEIPADKVNLQLFSVGGLTVHDNTPNVLMLGVQPAEADPVVTLQLLYVPPGQFAQASSSS